MTYYRLPVRHLVGRVPLSPAGFTPLVGAVAVMSPKQGKKWANGSRVSDIRRRPILLAKNVSRLIF